MERAVVITNVASVYMEPSAESERVTQTILGQPIEIEDDRGDWCWARTWDGYSCWIESRWLLKLPLSDPPYASTDDVAVVRALITDLFESLEPDAAIITKAVVSTELEIVRDQGRFVAVHLPRTGKAHLAFIKASDVKITNKSAGPLPLPPTGEELVAEAKRFIGVPYLWGGTTPFGIDCSGLVQLVFRINGIMLPRNSRTQAVDPRGQPVSRGDLQPGDLIFFAHDDRITHVGMSLGGDDFIHSAGEIGVTISSLKEEKYKRIYWGGKRIVV